MNLEFKINNNSFHARASAIIYNKDKTKVLLFKVNDGRDFYLLPGGRIEFNEDSLTAIKREIKEELGYELNYELCSVEENFLKRNNVNIMQYQFCYKAIYQERIETESFSCLDSDNQIFSWVNINELNNIKLFPVMIKEYIVNDTNNIIHNIDWREENE